MKIDRQYSEEPVNIQDFADKYNLTLTLWKQWGKYYCGFKNVRVVECQHLLLKLL